MQSDSYTLWTMADAVDRHGHQYPALNDLNPGSSRTVAHGERGPHSHRAGLATCRILQCGAACAGPASIRHGRHHGTFQAQSREVIVRCNCQKDRKCSLISGREGNFDIYEVWIGGLMLHLIDVTDSQSRTVDACAAIMHREALAGPCGDTRGDTHVRMRMCGS